MPTTLSEKAKKVKSSSTLAITAKAKELKAKGEDVVSFGAGEPDFPTPENICEAAIQAIENGATRYTPASGTNELKEAVLCVQQAGLQAEPDRSQQWRQALSDEYF